jgi:hypothetical protein
MLIMSCKGVYMLSKSYKSKKIDYIYLFSKKIYKFRK